MRTALLAGLVAGSVFLPATGVFAGEGSSLRGLKPPRDALESIDGSRAEPGEGLSWRAVEVMPPLAPRLSLYQGQLDRYYFSTGTASFSSGLYRPLGRIQPLGESDFSPLHDALPKYTLYNHVSQSLPGGWGLGFGVRQSEFNFANSNLLSFSAERYFGNFRGAYTLYSNRTDGSPLGSAHRFQVNYFYGERNVVGVAYTTGRDVENLGLSAIGLPVADVRDLALSGRHWLGTNWALTYDVLSHEQSILSARRQGLRLGVSRSF
jgi:YaiO family outer membrane protein